MSDLHAIKAADHLEINPLYAFLVVARERTSSIGVEFVLNKALKAMEKSGEALKSGLLAVLATITMLLSATPEKVAQAKGWDASQALEQSIHYTHKLWARWSRWWEQKRIFGVQWGSRSRLEKRDQCASEPCPI